jgi:hypothetical protein
MRASRRDKPVMRLRNVQGNFQTLKRLTKKSDLSNCPTTRGQPDEAPSQEVGTGANPSTVRREGFFAGRPNSQMNFNHTTKRQWILNQRHFEYPLFHEADQISITYHLSSQEEFFAHLREITTSQSDAIVLAHLMPVKAVEKYDDFVPEPLLDEANARSRLNTLEAATKLPQQLSAHYVFVINVGLLQGSIPRYPLLFPIVPSALPEFFVFFFSIIPIRVLACSQQSHGT